MNAPYDFHDTRCPRCGSASLHAVEAAKVTWNDALPSDDRSIRHDAIRCGSCRAGYDVIWGTPFLGAFDARDIVGLVEIAANARADNGAPDGATIRRLEHLLADYHGADDRARYVRDSPDDMARASWFPNRYNEWLHFKIVTAGIPFSGRRVLDVGAGSGVDSYRIVAAGAEVTALEYNPMLVSRGRAAVPEARWFGGLSHALPFVAGAFDIVCCNAALHHMRDVGVALEEMLRVLKPGGWLITTGDPYRARHLGEDHELAVFNRHPAVLLGVNESIPSFADFESTLERHAGKLDIRILTDALSPPRSNPAGETVSPIAMAAVALKRAAARMIGRPVGGHVSILPEGLQWWVFGRDREVLGQSSGSIALRCRTRKALSVPPRCHDEPVLSAGAYAGSLTDYQKAIQELAPHVPEHLINCPFPDTAQTKFALLNGWQAPDGGPGRSAYRRARWYLRRSADANLLTFSVRYPAASGAGPVPCGVLVNGIEILSRPLTSDWEHFAVPLAAILPGGIFVLEIRIDVDSEVFDDGLFEVRDRKMSGAPST